MNPPVADVHRDPSEDGSSLANGDHAAIHFGFTEAADSDLDSVDQNGASVISLRTTLHRPYNQTINKETFDVDKFSQDQYGTQQTAFLGVNVHR